MPSKQNTISFTCQLAFIDPFPQPLKPDIQNYQLFTFTHPNICTRIQIPISSGEPVHPSIHLKKRGPLISPPPPTNAPVCPLSLSDLLFCRSGGFRVQGQYRGTASGTASNARLFFCCCCLSSSECPIPIMPTTSPILRIDPVVFLSSAESRKGLLGEKKVSGRESFFLSFSELGERNQRYMKGSGRLAEISWLYLKGGIYIMF